MTDITTLTQVKETLQDIFNRFANVPVARDYAHAISGLNDNITNIVSFQDLNTPPKGEPDPTPFDGNLKFLYKAFNDVLSDAVGVLNPRTLQSPSPVATEAVNNNVAALNTLGAQIIKTEKEASAYRSRHTPEY